MQQFRKIPKSQMRLPKSGDYCKLYAKQKLIKVTRAQQPFEDTKGEIIIRKGQTTQLPKEKDKRTNNNLQNITQKTKDRVTRTPLKSGGGLGCSGRVISSCSTSDIRRVNLVTNPVISHE